MTRLSALVIALAVSGQIGLRAQTPPPPSLQITILEGEGALNNIKQQTAREPVVQVTDKNHKPVAGALVIFTLPQSGPSGTFADGSTVFHGVTDANGQVKTIDLTPNKVVGKYQIQVDAKFHDQSAHTSIAQSNFMGATLSAAHPAAHAIPMKAILIVGAVAGAAAVAVVASHSGGSNSPAPTGTSSPPTPTGVTITAGPPVVGAP